MNVPTINSITGDKLTAFAPNTTGYPYGKENGLQTIKQLFDLGFLFDLVNNFEMVANCTKRKTETLKKYLPGIKSIDDILDDVLNTSFLLAKFQLTLTESEKINFSELNGGVNQISNFLIFRPFNTFKAVEFAGKTALLAGKIKKSNFEKIEDFNAAEKYIIENDSLNFLNILKNQPNKSLFYFYQLAKLLS